MQPAPFEDPWLDVFAETCARLAAPFADRAAVLWRAGFDEPTWARFEAACLEAMADEAGHGVASRAARFAEGFAATRRALIDPAMPPTMRRSEGAPTLPWTTLVSPPEDAPDDAAEPAGPLDLAQAMTTLASTPGPAPSKIVRHG